MNEQLPDRRFAELAIGSDERRKIKRPVQTARIRQHPDFSAGECERLLAPYNRPLIEQSGERWLAKEGQVAWVVPLVSELQPSSRNRTPKLFYHSQPE